MISVPVPEEHVMAVYGFLASLEGSRPAQSGEAGPPGQAPEHWTDELVARAVRESSEKMSKGFVLIALAGDDGITTVDLGEQLDYERGAQAVAGMLGAAHRRCHHRYGMTEPLWRAEWEPIGSGPGGTSRLTMTPEIREWVLSVD